MVGNEAPAPGRPDWTALGRVFTGLSAPAVSNDAATERDRAEERAAILEYEAGMTRAEAEAMAGLGALSPDRACSVDNSPAQAENHAFSDV